MKKSGLRALLMLLILGLGTVEIRGQAPAVETSIAQTDSGKSGDAGPDLGKQIADPQADNLLRFGIESPSEDRSVRIFTENLIVMHAAILAGIFHPRPKTEKASASKGNALTVHASRGGFGLAKAWEF